jgi:pimeloyl-ACP methyl ester carboxylesterase
MSRFPVDARALLPSGLRLAYRDWGGAGAIVLLLHGLASSYRIWDLVAPLLTARFRVLALDQRGHGRSDRPDESFDFPTYVGDLLAFLQAIGLTKVLLVGHSWGGNVAVQFAVDHPGYTAGLVLVDGGFLELSARPGWTWDRAEQELAPPDLQSLSAAELLDRVSQGGLARVWSSAIAESVLGHFEVLPSGTVRPWLRREHHMRILRALWDHRPSLLWDRVRCPTLLIPARQSSPTGPRSEFRSLHEDGVLLAASRLARSRTIWMEDTIHDVPLQRPSELAAAIEAFAADFQIVAAPEPFTNS